MNRTCTYGGACPEGRKHSSRCDELGVCQGKRRGARPMLDPEPVLRCVTERKPGMTADDVAKLRAMESADSSGLRAVRDYPKQRGPRP